MRALLVLGLVLLVPACAEFSPDAGMTAVSAATREKIGGDTVKITSAADAQRARERVDALLADPLSADTAVQIALLNNKTLQAAYNDLGLTEIAGVEATLPPNPRFSLSRIAGSGIVEWEFRLLGNILALATMPARKRIARERFEQAQHVAIEATYRLALETRRAWVNAVTAQQLVGYLEHSRLAADATSDLLRKLGETGGATKLEQARAAAAYAELSAQLAQARLRARQERAALVALLGLWDRDIRLPAQLPALPARLQPVDNVESEAIAGRVDVAIARQEVAIQARSIDLAEATRFVSLLELSGLADTERDPHERTSRAGFELELEIPIFDGGQVKLRRERETYMRAVNRLAATAAAARSQARAAHDSWRATHEIAQLFQSRVLPLRRTIAQETLLRYNGMLSDIFELLTETRERVAANIAAIEARRAFMLAEIDLRAAVIGGGPSPMSSPSPTALPAANAGGGH